MCCSSCGSIGRSYEILTVVFAVPFYRIAGGIIAHTHHNFPRFPAPHSAHPQPNLPTTYPSTLPPTNLGQFVTHQGNAYYPAEAT